MGAWWEPSSTEINFEISFSGKTIALWGQGHILDAAGNARIFNGEGPGSSLTLHDVVLRNGQNGDGGGAIHATDGAYVEVHNSTFQSNSAHLKRCIGVSYGYLMGARCRSDSDCNDGGYCSRSGDNDGGAIYAGHSDTRIVIYSSEFKTNVGYYGGAIYASPAAIVEIHDCTFQDNAADIPGLKTRGGCIYLSETAYLEIHASEFTGNFATWGSVICALGASAAIYNSTFVLNGAIDEDYDGGAIKAQSSDVEIHDSTFTANDADCGGALYILFGTMQIYGTIFESNSALR
jgi:hypothetical protein